MSDALIEFTITLVVNSQQVLSLVQPVKLKLKLTRIKVDSYKLIGIWDTFVLFLVHVMWPWFKVCRALAIFRPWIRR